MEANNNPKLVQSGPEWYETGLAYRYQTPDGPGPYPTVVMLHGRMGNEDVMWVFRKTIPRPWFVVAPRAPLADHGYYSWLIHQSGTLPDRPAFDATVDALIRFIQALPRLYNADPDRTYLMGFSQGAALSFATALLRPELIHGIASLVGFFPAAPESEIVGRLKDMPVFMAAGTEDDTIPLELSQASAELVRLAGADLDYHEYPSGHKLPSAGMADLRRWFNSRS